jgi:hypothetical protein
MDQTKWRYHVIHKLTGATEFSMKGLNIQDKFIIVLGIYLIKYQLYAKKILQRIIGL